MRVTRRTVLAGGLAACLGCTGGDDAGEAAEGARPARDLLTGGFGSVIEIGTVDDVRAAIRDGKGFLYLPEGRAWLVEYPEDALDAAREVYDEETVRGMDAGFVALYQKCTHLGCRAPECTSSQRFECPCHGAVFNRVGEKVSGPAPRGLDRFPIRVEDGAVIVDTGTIIEGAPEGVATIDEEPPGPPCIAAPYG